jgi:hypothetical protein
MNVAKDSTKVIKFMTLFQKLRNLIDDEPEGLEVLAAGDEPTRPVQKQGRWGSAPLRRPGGSAHASQALP